ncbi:MAG TPA: sigma-70 family RNA polymerase sigma factor [Chloroflexi bacterium]|nr:sigma-70 family RNA polymerase sigma factor [Chloroflexota bacterium]
MIEASQNAQKQESKYPLNPEEAVWVSQAQRGDRVAFTRIVEAYQRPVYNVCYRMLGNAVEAEDAAQEVFVRAFFKLETYDPERKFSSWLFSIASHYAIDLLRKRRIQVISWDDLPPWRWLPSDDSPQPEEAMLEAEAAQEVHALLDALPGDYRAAVVLKYWHNMPYEEIAQTLNTTVSAIKSKLFRARKMLAKAAQKEQEATRVSGRIALASAK